MNVKQVLAWTGCCVAVLGLAVSRTEAKDGSGGVDAAAMLAAHNEWRATAGVPALRWSAPLAAAAQNWAEHLAASGCGQTTSGGEYGENLFWASAMMWSDGTKQISTKQPKEVVASWGEEGKQYDHASNSCSSVCGNYTQLVWKDTKEVGCGMAICPDKAQIWVCNYNPPGNIVGKKPY